jgi:hypothetical protein
MDPVQPIAIKTRSFCGTGEPGICSRRETLQLCSAGTACCCCRDSLSLALVHSARAHRLPAVLMLLRLCCSLTDDSLELGYPYRRKHGALQRRFGRSSKVPGTRAAAARPGRKNVAPPKSTIVGRRSLGAGRMPYKRAFAALLDAITNTSCTVHMHECEDSRGVLVRATAIRDRIKLAGPCVGINARSKSHDYEPENARCMLENA